MKTSLPFLSSLAIVFASLAGACSSSRSSEMKSVAARSHSAPVTQFGAVGDGVTLNTAKIQAGIDSIAASGGGTLLIPKGVFLSGAIFLKPGVNLHLDQGAVLKGSADIRDYPEMTTRIEGHSEPFLPALVNADGVDHLRITGDGTIDGNGTTFWAAFWQRRKENPACTNLEVRRPRIMFLQNCQNLLVYGLTLKDSGFWNLHLYRCRDVVLDGLDIHVPIGVSGVHAPSSDGMDIDSCQRVTVTDCAFAVNDDCIALKGTKGPFALDDKKSGPVEHIRIKGCTFKAGYAALTCGSEATVVRDVIMDHCTVLGSMPLLHLKLRPDTPQLYEDIHVQNVIMHDGTIFDVSPWKQFFDLKGQPAPQSTVRNVSVRNITGSLDSLGWITPHSRTTIENITLEDFDVKLKSDQFKHQKIDGLKINNVKVNGTLLAERR